MQVAGGALQTEFAQRTVGAAQGVRIVTARVHDQFGQQGVVARAGGVAGVAVAIDADARPTGRLIGAERATGRAGAAVGGHAFQIDAQLHGKAAGGGDAGLGQAQFRQRLAGGELNLRYRQIQTGHRLGYRMFNLNARVGFHKHEVAALLVEQKLDGTQAAVANRAGQGAGGGVQLLAHRRIKARRRSDFQQLLVAALEGAVALPDVGNLGAVADDLHFDMTCAADQSFDIQIATAKGGGGLGAAAGEGVVQLGKVVHRAHAASAAASQRLEHHRCAVAE